MWHEFDHLRDTLRKQAGVEVYEQAVADNGGPSGHGPGWAHAGAEVADAVHAFPLGTRAAAYYTAKVTNAISGDAPNEWR